MILQFSLEFLKTLIIEYFKGYCFFNKLSKEVQISDERLLIDLKKIIEVIVLLTHFSWITIYVVNNSNCLVYCSLEVFCLPR